MRQRLPLESLHQCFPVTAQQPEPSVHSAIAKPSVFSTCLGTVRPSSLALYRIEGKKAICCRIFTPAQPDYPAASVRDYRSGVYISRSFMRGERRGFLLDRGL